MRSASSMFSEADRKRVAQAVADAEDATSAEIVPVVATDSGRYDRAEDLVGLLTGIGAMVIVWLLFQREDPTAGGWDGLRVAVGLPMLVILLLVGFIAGAMLAMSVAPLRRLFTPRREMHDEVHRRATQHFYDRRIHHTPDASGMLVYLSLFERRAVILADEAVFEKLGQGTIDELCTGLIAAVRSGGVTDALCTTICSAGEKLSKELPRSEADAAHSDGGTIRDALVTID
jgi:putative membrane protein